MSAEATARWAVRAALVAILAAGFAVRAARIAEVTRAPDFAHPAVDAGFHDWWGRTLAGVPLEAVEGRDAGLLERPYLRAPGYPWFLALVYRASGGSYLAPRIAQCALGLLSALLLWRIGRRWLGELEGLLAAAGLALHWVVVYFETELQATSLVIALTLLALYSLGRFADRPRASPAVLAGLALGLAALVRPNALFVAGGALLWMLWIARAERVPALRSALGFVLALALAISPATLRNALRAGDAVLISSNAGINLYIGNHERATGLVSAHLPGIGRFETCFDYPAIVRRVERLEGRELRDSQVSRWFAGRALEWMRSNPGRALQLAGRKTLLFFGPGEVAHNKALVLERAHSRVLRFLPAPFAAVLALALLGGWCTWRRPGARRDFLALIAIVVVTWFLSVLPFFAAARYRVPILPPLLLLAAAAVAEIVRALRARDFVRCALLSGAGALLTALAALSPYQLAPDASKWHLDRGRALRRAGDEAAAVGELRSALEANPRSLDAQLSLADALAATGRPDQAERHYLAFLERRPHDSRALNNLGALLSGRGAHERALEVFERALERARDPAEVHANLGLVHERAGRPGIAAEEFRRALELSPGLAPARRGLRRVESGRPPDDDAERPR